MLTKYAQLILLAMLLAAPAFGQGVKITETRTFGMIEVLDPSPSAYTNRSERTYIVAEEQIAYPSDTTLVRRVRISREVVIAGSNQWITGGWYSISLKDARTLLDSIRALDHIQARLARFSSEGADHAAEAEFTFSILDASNSDFIGTYERFWIRPMDFNLPMMVSAGINIRNLPEGDQPAARRRTLQEFADLLEQAVAYLDRD